MLKEQLVPKIFFKENEKNNKLKMKKIVKQTQFSLISCNNRNLKQ